MKKLFGIAILTFAVVFSFACGGGGGGEGTSATIMGTIDSSVVSKSQIDSEEYEVWARSVSSGELLRKGTIASSSSGEDHIYTISGLSSGTTYEIALVRIAGFSKSDVLSSVVTASESTSSLSKTLYIRQMNVVTTYVARRFVKAVASDTTVTLTSVVTAVFGSAISLDDVIMDAGKVTTTSSVAITFADPVARTAINQLTIQTTAIVSMSVETLAENSSNSETLTTTLVTATTVSTIVTAVTDTTSGLSSLVSQAISDTTSAAFSSALAAADAYTAAAVGSDVTSALTTMTTTTIAVQTLAVETMTSIVTGGTLNSTFTQTLATDAGITTSTLQDQTVSLVESVGSSAGLSSDQIQQAAEVAGGTVNVVSFTLAHATYGTKSGDDFTINTLAPVFKIVLNSPLSGSFSDSVDVTITGSTSSISNSSLDDDTLVRTITSSDNKTFYLMVKKAASTTITSGSELSPGAGYDYSVTPKSGKTLKVSDTEVSSVAGTINVKNITFTYPITSSTTDSLVDLDIETFQGLSSTTPTFLIHSSGNIDQYNGSDTTGYGILGNQSVTLTMTLQAGNSTITGLQSGTHLTVSNPSASASQVAVKTSAGLTTSTSYTLSFSAVSGLTMDSTAVTTSDLPSEQTMDIQ